MEFVTKNHIDGKWVDGEEGKNFEVLNPANMQVIANISYSSTAHTLQAVKAADNAFKSWGNTSGKERSRILRKLYELMGANRDQFAQLITLENGKTLVESYGEIEYSMSFVEWFAEEAKRIYGDIIPFNKPTQKLFAFKEPIGVVAAITPWNFPLAMLARKVTPALAAGCTMVIKPANETPLSALYFVKLCQEAGVPPGVLNIVCGHTNAIGEVLTSAPEVKMLTFTGSTEVGKMLMAKASKTVKKVILELGGNAPFIVFKDANLEKAAIGLVSSKLRNGGQSCICPNRIFISNVIIKQFTDLLIDRFSQVKVGNGMDTNCQIGPMISSASVARIKALIDGATNNGAKIVYQTDIKEQLAKSKCFFPPTIIMNNKSDQEIEKTEIFGPVLSVFGFDSEEEVVARSNNTNYGLASYFYSENKDVMWRVARDLQYGMVGVNDFELSSEVACFGGVKESGLGREGGKEGINEYLEHKFLVMS